MHKKNLIKKMIHTLELELQKDHCEMLKTALMKRIDFHKQTLKIL